jgi:acyl-CoA hydrolase
LEVKRLLRKTRKTAVLRTGADRRGRGFTVKVTGGTFVYVALDENGRPRRVPKE